MIDKDPNHNLLFSLHLYADWREAAKYDQSSDYSNLFDWDTSIVNLLLFHNQAYSPYDKALLGQIVDKGLPLLIGEFAGNFCF